MHCYLQASPCIAHKGQHGTGAEEIVVGWMWGHSRVRGVGDAIWGAHHAGHRLRRLFCIIYTKQGVRVGV